VHPPDQYLAAPVNRRGRPLWSEIRAISRGCSAYLSRETERTSSGRWSQSAHEPIRATARVPRHERPVAVKKSSPRRARRDPVAPSNAALTLLAGRDPLNRGAGASQGIREGPSPVTGTPCATSSRSRSCLPRLDPWKPGVCPACRKQVRASFPAPGPLFASSATGAVVGQVVVATVDLE
jgi:hypothetical protein